jgi:hypothetical protein
MPGRASGSFKIPDHGAVVQRLSHRYCYVVQRDDGYAYA